MEDKKIIIVGEPGIGHSKMLAQVLAEKGLTLDDIIVIDSTDTAKSLQERLTAERLEPEPMIIDDMNRQFREEIENVDISIYKKDAHPFSKFIGKKKWQK